MLTDNSAVPGFQTYQPAEGHPPKRRIRPICSRHSAHPLSQRDDSDRLLDTDVAIGDILLDKGGIRVVGWIGESVLKLYENITDLDAEGAWVTLGYVFLIFLAFFRFVINSLFRTVDLHLHLGLGSSPSLRGSSDTRARALHFPGSASTPPRRSWVGCICG